jgi:hypothetical protein
MTEQIHYWHCDNCGWQTEGTEYGHPKYCLQCRHSKDWQSGKTANCQTCELYKWTCHEMYKGTCPEYHKTCLYYSQFNCVDSMQTKKAKE